MSTSERKADIAEFLRQRLREPEDQFTERKENAHMEDIAATLVAFANTLPHGHEALLFVGITDAGEIKGLDNPDKTQKSIQRVAATRCYPPVPLQRLVVLEDHQKKIVAVVVPYSDSKPHFAGPAYIRVGSQNVNATEDQLNFLIDARHSKTNLILESKTANKKVTLTIYGSSAARRIVTVGAEVVECNSHYVRLVSDNGFRSYPLSRIELSWDEAHDRLKLEVRSVFLT